MVKRTLLIFALLVFCCEAIAAPIKGAGATSCGSWLKERRNGAYSSDLNWVLGFISAYNHYLDHSPQENGIFGSADPEAIAAWMDNYCNANPLSNPYTGSVKLIEELQKMRR